MAEEVSRDVLEKLLAKYNFREPNRGNLDDPNITWKTQKPNYDKANFAFLNGKTQNHKAGSLEEVAENLVKTWEMEATHKPVFEQWTTVDYNNYTVQVNGIDEIEGKVAMKIGNYNALMKHCPAYQKYGVTDDFEGSHKLFFDAFPGGFPWELLKVISGPPHILFTWRHWATFSGTFRDVKGKGQTIVLFGLCRVTVNDQLKIQKLEVFYDPDSFLTTLECNKDSSEQAQGQSLVGDTRQTAIEKKEQEKL